MAIAGANYLQGAGSLQLGGTTQTTAGGQTLQNATGGNIVGTLKLPSQPTPVSTPQPGTGTNNYQGQIDALNRANALIASIQNSNKQVYAPTLDFNAINAQARQSAEAGVNPYYTAQINKFVSDQAVQKQQKQAQYETNVKTLEENLKNTLEGNTLTGERTAQDVAQKEQAVNTQADQFQTDSGQQFATDRITQARDIAAAGLTGGIGAQQQEATQAARNTTEGRQTDQFQQAKDQQELFKTRTFEDLGRSSSQATAGEAKGAAQERFNLDTYIQNQGIDLSNKQTDLEQQRQAAVDANAQKQKSLLVQQFIGSIANPAQRNAALQAYGSFL